jgi:hypothetical protein
MLTLALWPFYAPWYLLTLIPIAALLDHRAQYGKVLLLSATSALIYLFQYCLRAPSGLPVGFWSVLAAVTVFGSYALTIPAARWTLRNRKQSGQELLSRG